MCVCVYVCVCVVCVCACLYIFTYAYTVHTCMRASVSLPSNLHALSHQVKMLLEEGRTSLLDDTKTHEPYDKLEIPQVADRSIYANVYVHW